MRKISPEMETAIDRLFSDIAENYALTSGVISPEAKVERGGAYERIWNQFHGGMEYTVGGKYIKLLNKKRYGVWGFIVNSETDTKFDYGDILKAASLAAPARNYARGNLFTGYEVSWTGPLYMDTIVARQKKIRAMMDAASKEQF